MRNSKRILDTLECIQKSIAELRREIRGIKKAMDTLSEQLEKAQQEEDEQAQRALENWNKGIANILGYSGEVGKNE